MTSILTIFSTPDMNTHQLFLIIEGLDDRQLFEAVIILRLTNHYDDIRIIESSQKTKEFLRNLVRTCNHRQVDYWKINDIDGSPCITQKKESLRGRNPDVPVDRILVVVKEIEGWYTAGLTNEACAALKARFDRTPDEMTKEDFIRCIPNNYISTRAFMQDILRHYSFDEARIRSSSFHYCMSKLGL